MSSQTLKIAGGTLVAVVVGLAITLVVVLNIRANREQEARERQARIEQEAADKQAAQERLCQSFVNELAENQRKYDRSDDVGNGGCIGGPDCFNEREDILARMVAAGCRPLTTDEIYDLTN
jgi:mannitol-specific phosphotransferase system IIBC component